jgi:hypothetical protein
MCFPFLRLFVGLRSNVSISGTQCRVVVQGAGPGPRYGHCMDLVAQRYLVTVSGNDGQPVNCTSIYC